MNRRLLITCASFLFVVVGTIIAIRYARGDRPSRTEGVRSTGLLNANSFPTGASVYINGNLTSATDTNLNLAPGDYDVEIKKEGYFAWKKRLHLEKELVTQTNALLLPIAPGLSPLTYIGAENVHPSPDGQKLLFSTASASASRNNGLYVLDLNDNPLALQKGPRLIARTTSSWPLEKAHYLWSPDSDQVLISLGTKNILLDAGKFTEIESASDITITLNDVLTSWEEQLAKRETTQLAKFPPEFVRIATQSAKNIFLSPDQERVMYTATAAATIPDELIPPVQAASTQSQQRELKPGNTYVYDRKEDRNFLVAEAPGTVKETVISLIDGTKPSPTPASKAPKATPEAFTKLQEKNDLFSTIENFQRHYSGLYTGGPQWLPDSKHVISYDATTISIVEYDGTNKTQVYAGPFSNGLVYPWPNGSKLVILTNFNQGMNLPTNLYALSIR